MRLFRYLPILIPLVVRFIRSPKGQETINRFRNRRDGSGPSSRPRR